jgi:hypothetical protein
MSVVASTTFGQYFQENIQPPTQSEPDIDWIVKSLQQHGQVARVFKVGSAVRHTWIRPINDIDLFVVLKPEVLYDVTLSQLVHTLLGIVKTRLGTDWTTKGDVLMGKPSIVRHFSIIARQQKASIGLAFDSTSWADVSTGVRVDLVPAIAMAESRYLICRDNKPLLSNPDAMARNTKDLMQKQPQFIDLVRVAKKWNKLQVCGPPFKSFHLEVLCQRIVAVRRWKWRNSLLEMLPALFAELAMRCSTPHRVPGISGVCVSLKEDIDVSELRNRLQLAAKTIEAGDWCKEFH